LNPKEQQQPQQQPMPFGNNFKLPSFNQGTFGGAFKPIATQPAYPSEQQYHQHHFPAENAHHHQVDGQGLLEVLKHQLT